MRVLIWIQNPGSLADNLQQHVPLGRSGHRFRDVTAASSLPCYLIYLSDYFVRQRNVHTHGPLLVGHMLAH
jgi:hypothetical protein